MVSTLIGLVIAGVTHFINQRGKKNAIKEAEKAKAEADLIATAKNYIVEAENTFDGFDKMLKAQGNSAGKMKKDNVLARLQTYALLKGYDFDVEEWSSRIDELVEFTKEVNPIRVN
jgi:hypothetical protein